MSRIYYQNFRGVTLLARDLRKKQTPSEKLLWEVLRKKNLLGYKFLRQHPIFYREDKGWIEFFIADFYCARLQLVVELDGEVHANMKDYDSERDSILLNKGIKVIRIRNEELADMNSVIDLIKNAIVHCKTFTPHNIDNVHDTTPSLIV